jgi:hypothetical protein
MQNADRYNLSITIFPCSPRLKPGAASSNSKKLSARRGFRPTGLTPKPQRAK